MSPSLLEEGIPRLRVGGELGRALASAARGRALRGTDGSCRWPVPTRWRCGTHRQPFPRHRGAPMRDPTSNSGRSRYLGYSWRRSSRPTMASWEYLRRRAIAWRVRAGAEWRAGPPRMGRRFGASVLVRSQAPRALGIRRLRDAAIQLRPWCFQRGVAPGGRADATQAAEIRVRVPGGVTPGLGSPALTRAAPAQVGSGTRVPRERATQRRKSLRAAGAVSADCAKSTNPLR